MDSVLKPIGPLAKLLDVMSEGEKCMLLVALSTPEEQRSDDYKKFIASFQQLVMIMSEK